MKKGGGGRRGIRNRGGDGEIEEEELAKRRGCGQAEEKVEEKGEWTMSRNRVWRRGGGGGGR